jgi:hypothetical protein
MEVARIYFCDARSQSDDESFDLLRIFTVGYFSLVLLWSTVLDTDPIMDSFAQPYRYYCSTVAKLVSSCVVLLMFLKSSELVSSALTYLARHFWREFKPVSRPAPASSHNHHHIPTRPDPLISQGRYNPIVSLLLTHFAINRSLQPWHL